MVRHLLPIAIFVWLNAFVAHAQVEKTFFQTYDIKDGVRRVYLQSFDEYELRPWNGTQLMVETSAKLEGGNMDLLGIIIKDGFFSFYIEEGSEGVVLRPKFLSRPQIKHNGQICKQVVKMFIYVPEEFNILSHGELIRKEIIVAKNKNP
jgi:hypothetical protein